MTIKEHLTQRVKIRDIKALPFNRILNMKQVDKLLKSMTIGGILRDPVLIKAKLTNSKIAYWTADGQHMLAALNRVDHESVNCKIVETEDLCTIVNIMASLNNVNLRWMLDDYVNAYSALCNKEYEKLRMHKISTGLNYATSALILGETINHNVIKNGNFKSTAKDADKVTAELIDVISFLGTSNSKFMKAFIKFRRSSSITYDHKRFMQKLAQNKSVVKIVHDEGAMKEILEALYK